MRKLISIFIVSVLCLSCSHDSDSPSPDIKEKVTITWHAYSQTKELEGKIRVDVYTHDGKTYGTDSVHNNVYLELVKGDYVTFNITPLPTDQAQNEAGIELRYVVSGSKGIICEGNTNGTGFLIK